MLSLRSILVVAAAFVSLVSAVPVAAESEGLVALSLDGQPVGDPVPGNVAGTVVNGVGRRDYIPSLADQIKATQDRISPVLDALSWYCFFY